MRISRLVLTNFGLHENLTIDVPADKKVIIVTGENATGKSTVLDAIAFALTGRCRGVDGAGKGLRELLRTGAGPRFGVILDGVHDGKPLALKRGAGQGPRSDFQQAIPWQPGQVLASLYYRHLLKAKPADQQELLRALVQGGLDFETILRADDSPLWVEATQVVCGRPYCGLEELETLAGELKTTRLVAHQTVKRGLIDPPAPLEGLAALDSNAAGAMLETLTSKVRDLFHARDEAYEALARSGGSAEELQQRITDLEAEATGLQQQERVDLNSFAAAAAAAQQAEDEADGAVRLLEDQRPALRQKQLHAADAIAVAEKKLAGPRAPAVGVLCGECGRKHSLKSLAYLKKAHPGALDAVQAADLEQQVQTHRQAVADYSEALEHLDTQLCEAQQAAATANTLHHEAEAEHRAERTAEDGLDADHREIMGKLAAAKQRLAKLAPGADLAGFATALDKRYEQAEAKVTALSGYVNARAQWEGFRDHLQAAERRHADADRLLKELLGPSGSLRAQLLGGSAAASFVANVNAMLDAWHRPDLGLDPGALPALRFAARPSSRLSRSEGLRVGLPLGAAIAKVAGFGLVAVDDADALDAAGRQALAAIVNDLNLDQVWVCQTLRGQRSQTPDTTGSTFHYVLLPERVGETVGVVGR